MSCEAGIIFRMSHICFSSGFSGKLYMSSWLSDALWSFPSTPCERFLLSRTPADIVLQRIQFQLRREQEERSDVVEDRGRKSREEASPSEAVDLQQVAYLNRFEPGGSKLAGKGSRLRIGYLSGSGEPLSQKPASMLFFLNFSSLVPLLVAYAFSRLLLF